MKKRIVAILTSIFILLMIIIMVVSNEDDFSFFSVIVQIDGMSENISCWQNDDGQLYMFLPGYADFSDMTVDLTTEKTVYLDGVHLIDGMRCDIFQLDIPYELTYEKWGGKYSSQLTFVQSDGVGTMFIDTASCSMDYIHARKGNAEVGQIRLYTIEGTLDYSGVVQKIKGRGNATWLFYDKKPYSIELQNEAELLKMGKARRWILLSNPEDPSNMRNKVVFDFAREIGLEYSPDSQWVDLYLNGEYVGLYLLSERNEVHQERVNLRGQDSFLVSLEREERLIAQNYPYIITENEQALRIHYPDNPNEETCERIYDIFQSIENAILSEDGIDHSSGKHFGELVDLDSWVKKYLIEEIFANYDACYISQYFYYNKECGIGKVFAGPVWDYDYSIRYTLKNVKQNEIFAARLLVENNSQSPWFNSLLLKNEFYTRMVQVYQSEFLPKLVELLDVGIDNYWASIKQASKLDSIRWEIEEDGAEATKGIITYLSQRIDFLNRFWTCKDRHHVVRVDRGNGEYYVYYLVTHGESLSEISNLENNEYRTFIGWYYADTDEPFDPTAPIYEDTEIYAKWVDSDSNKMQQIIKLIPLAIIALMGVCVLGIEIRRNRKYRCRNDR